MVGTEGVELRCFAIPKAKSRAGQYRCITSPDSIHLQEDSLQDVLAQIDNAIQYGEDADVKIQDFDEMGGDGDM